MSPELMNLMVNETNTLRSETALGNMPHYSPSAYMLTVQWDPELANLTSLNARNCTFQHDKCRNTGE